MVYVGSATPEEVVDAISKKLGPIARPRGVIRVDSLPRNELERSTIPLRLACSVSRSAPGGST